MFLAAKTFSTSRRVHNHFTKRILNLILNRKKFLRRENDPLDKQKPRQNRREPPPRKQGFANALASPRKFRFNCGFRQRPGS